MRGVPRDLTLAINLNMADYGARAACFKLHLRPQRNVA
jgi:hypothetical protein